MSLVQMSVSAGVMIALISVVRLLLLHRLPKNTFLVLWWIVLVRLLIPFSFPSPVSIFSVIGERGANGYVADAADGNLPVLNSDMVVEHEGVSGIGSGEESVSVGRVLRLVWLAGGLLCAVFFFVCYFRCRRLFAEALPAESEVVSDWLAQHELKRPLTVRQSSWLKAPLSYGVLRPVILIPKQKNWDVRDLDCVLWHEFIHVRRFDGLTKFFLAAALCVHWFNPFVWIMYGLANRDLELSCDEAVVRALGQAVRSTYAMALISMEERKGRLAPFASGFSRFAIEERIQAVMKYKKTTFGAVLASVAIIAGLSFGFAASGSVSGSTGTVPVPDRAFIETPDVETLEQALVFDRVELRYYEGGWPYLHRILTNRTDQTVVDTQYCMLAYDEAGNPLKLKWLLLDSGAEFTYDWIVEDDTTLMPGQTSDPDGGWSLYDGEKMEGWPKVGDGGPNQTAYALFCIKQVTFQDGTVWENPGYREWLETYRGNAVDISALQRYYPYVHPVIR
ncbi:M56 family metallopeptidase [Lachnospiraceae bacterium ASD3451]|uniref:M56 family metallopeptidase n=1 Tax=Diplocloster agilis TaxID=2850323 RepID=UPI001D223E86|nr:M56 family metallopeptidase [Diplocloster agilis]MBU9745429.1 M56 family metallopeptidase [Diplocloster agilis]